LLHGGIEGILGASRQKREEAHMKLFYVPVPSDESYPNYENSILSCVTHDNKELSDVLQIDGLVGLWGFKSGVHNDREYNQIDVGDVLFFRINDGNYQAFDGFGYISKKLSSASIGKQVWGDSLYEHLLVIDRYYRFHTPFRLSEHKTQRKVASITGIPQDVWHKQYNMLRKWHMSEDHSKLIVDALSDKSLSLNLYRNCEDAPAEADETDPEVFGAVDLETERNATRIERRGQNRFRRDLLLDKGACEICGIDDERLLIASHIRSWRSSDNHKRRDKNNGLLLCALHDKLFDKGLISFSPKGTIVISPTISEANKMILKIPSDIRIEMNKPKKDYMEWHRENTYQDGIR
jgi:hypothetical protein